MDLDQVKWAISAPPSVKRSLRVPEKITNLQVYPACNYSKHFNQFLSEQHLTVLHYMTAVDFRQHIFQTLNSAELESLKEQEKCRLKTFGAGWPHENTKYLNMSEMARVGFFFTGLNDVVRCAFCSQQFSAWQLNDRPYDVHRIRSSACREAVKRFASRNITKTKLEWNPAADNLHDVERQRIVTYQQEEPIRYDVDDNVEVGERSATLGFSTHIPINPVTDPGMLERYDSFVEWPHLLPDADHLFTAGFAYVGFGDIVTCPSCEIILQHWQEDDDPWREHARWSPECPFLVHKKGKGFIEQVRAGMPNNEKLVLKDYTHKNLDPTTQASYQACVNSGWKAGLLDAAIQRNYGPFSNATELIRAARKLETCPPLEYGCYSDTNPPPHSIAGSNQAQRSPSPERAIKYLFQEELRSRESFKPGEESADALSCKNCELLLSIFTPAEHIGLPCGHLLYCTPCVNETRDHANRYPGDIKCPIDLCRTTLTGSSKVIFG